MESLATLLQKVNEKGIAATRDIQREETILMFEQNFVSVPSNRTLRISESVHQVSADPYALENFVNHSCEANAYIDFEKLSLRASMVIAQGEEITYNYFTSDWDGEDAFECRCRAANCKGYVAGFKHLSLQERLLLFNQLSPFPGGKLYDF